MKRMPNYKILALDIATHCGWAINVSETSNIYGVWDLSPKRDESAGMRLIRFRSKLNEVIERENINIVVFERPAGRHVGAVIVQSELQGQVKVICEDKRISYRGFSSQEIKKFATGKGNANKEAMKKAARERFGYVGNDDNEADAICLLHLAKVSFSYA